MDGTGSEQLENRRLHFQDAGEWARHYSTVRMTVATFVITSCVAILALKWDASPETGAPPPNGPALGELNQADHTIDAHVVNSVAILWLLGIGIFHAFTYYTFDRLNSQLKHRAKLLTDDETADRIPTHPAMDHASWAIAVLSFFFAYFIWTSADDAIHPALRIVVYFLCLESLLFPIWLYLHFVRKSRRGKMVK
jgi:hypothetical protein